MEESEEIHKLERKIPDLKGMKQAYACVFECIEMFYNTVGRHSTNDYLCPNRYKEYYYEKCV